MVTNQNDPFRICKRLKITCDYTQKTINYADRQDDHDHDDEELITVIESGASSGCIKTRTY